MHNLTKIVLAVTMVGMLAACGSLVDHASSRVRPAEMLGGNLVGIAVTRRGAEAYGPRPKGGYPVATPTERKSVVISPYVPYREIDVRGLRRHDLVRDPSCGRLFVQPDDAGLTARLESY